MRYTIATYVGLVRQAGKGPKKLIPFTPRFLPLAGVAAAVETGRRPGGSGSTRKKCVGKFLRARTAESFKDHGELPRIVAHVASTTLSISARNDGLSRSLSFVPIVRVDEFRAGGSVKRIAILRATLIESALSVSQ